MDLSYEFTIKPVVKLPGVFETLTASQSSLLDYIFPILDKLLKFTDSSKRLFGTECIMCGGPNILISFLLDDIFINSTVFNKDAIISIYKAIIKFIFQLRHVKFFLFLKYIKIFQNFVVYYIEKKFIMS